MQYKGFKFKQALFSQVRVLAGVEYTRRGRPKPTVAGPLCLAQHTGRADRRRDDDFPTFRRFNRTLKHVCEEVSKSTIFLKLFYFTIIEWNCTVPILKLHLG